MNDDIVPIQLLRDGVTKGVPIGTSRLKTRFASKIPS
jgi:hypothetical protein